MEYDDRITTEYHRTDHIWLTCRDHDLEHFWSTKNIGGIGARTLYYELGGDTSERECPCPMSRLRAITMEEHIAALESGRLPF